MVGQIVLVGGGCHVGVHEGLMARLGCSGRGVVGRRARCRESEGAGGHEAIKMSNRNAQTTATAEQESGQLREGRGSESEGQLHFKHSSARGC